MTDNIIELEKPKEMPYNLFMDLLEDYLGEDDPVGKSFIKKKSYYKLLEETFVDDLDS